MIFTNRYSANLIGVDGTSFWPHVVEGTSCRRDLIGKQLAISIVITPVVVIVALGLGIAFQALTATAFTIALLPAMLGIHLGIGAVSSARFPQALPERGNPFGTVNGQGCANGLSAIVMLTIELIIMTPLAIALVVAQRHAPAAVPFIVLVAYGLAWAVWRAGTNNAATFLTPRLAEILATVDPRSS